MQGCTIPWRDRLLYEYPWGWNFPQTPTHHALRTTRYIYIRPHGLWDLDELYDLENDPHEIKNFAPEPPHQARIKEMNAQFFQNLKESDGMTIPMFEDRDAHMAKRLCTGTPPATFPPHLQQN